MLDIGGKQRVSFVDREVVADRTIAAQDLLQQLVAVHGELQRHSEVIVVERCRVAEHVERIVATARDVLDADAGDALDQVDDLRLDTVDHLHLAALQRGQPRRRVIDDDDLDLVGMARLVAAPVICEALAAMTHTGLVDCDLVGAGADAGIRIVLAAIRLDDEMVVGHQIGKSASASPSVTTTSSPFGLMPLMFFSTPSAPDFDFSSA